MPTAMTAMGKALRFTRGLRFRLAISYVFFFTILLALLGIALRQTLRTSFKYQMQSALDEQWGAAKGYLRTGSTGPYWVFDKEDPDESFIVNRLRRVYLLTDTQGRPLEHSGTYGSIGLDSPAEIKKILQSGQPATRTRRDRQGISYMIRSGLMIDERQNQYYLAIGRAVDYNDNVIRRFTWIYFSLLPVVIVVTGLLGWLTPAASGEKLL
jgi:hypothetical protein